MTRSKTVLVLGAGASRDYGFPLGRTLRDDVCRICRDATPSLCEITGFSAADFEGFGRRLAESGYTSVDWYLEVNPDDMAIGCRAIAAALTSYEDSERLFPGPANHWYEVLLNGWWHEEEASLDNGRHITILTFNYDRSLEVYLGTAAARRSGQELEAVVKRNGQDEMVIAGGPTVVHLHGQLRGPYSRTWSPERLDADGLSLLSSADHGSHQFERGRAAIRVCQTLLFLGFGFNAKSVARLGDFSDQQFVAGKEISGTRGGFVQPKWDAIRSRLFPHGWSDRNGWGSVNDFVQYNEL